MAGLANLLTPSTETIRGISDRTGMNLPDLPYGGILSLLTGGTGGFIADNLMKYTIPKIAEAFDPSAGAGLENAITHSDNSVQGHRDAVLDNIFGTAPQVDMTGAYDGIFDNPQSSWSGNTYSPDSMQNYGLNANEYPMPALGIPSFDAPNIGMDFEQMPAFSQFDFQDSMPNFDYTDFDFSKGGKV